jgi:FkbM family methyltransferase
LRRRLRSLAEYPDSWRLVTGPRSFIELRRLENPSARRLRSGQTVQIRFRALGGAPIGLRPGTQDDGLARDVFFKSHHLPPAQLPPEQIAVVWDLGANVGLTMAHMATLLPSARIVGVELDEQNMRLARRNVAHWGERCEIVHAAVWTEDGTIAYEREAGQEQSFHVSDADAGGGAPATSRAPATSLNTLLERTGASRVDYVKMDIEGAEMQVLKEGTDWAQRVRSIKVEVHAPYTVEQCAADLERLGFRTEPIPKRRGGVVGVRP